MSDGLRDARFAPHQALPPGYRVVWVESLEHYMWIHEATDRESVITWNRWQARRWAWNDFREVSGRAL